MILVFGKTGQVASELLKFNETVSLDRGQVNLNDPTACRNVIKYYKPSAVINAAAYTAVDKAEEEEYLANLVNAESPGAMAIVCAESDIPLVHISTDYVFDGSGFAALQTSDATVPKNAYGRSKLKGEVFIQESGCIYAILRTSWIISAHGNNFVKTMLVLSETKDTLNVVDDQFGGPTCAKDIAKACISIAKQLIKTPNKSGIYHFSGRPDVSWCQLANVIFEQAGKKTVAKPIPTSEYPTLAARPINSRLNCGSTESTFNISRPDWREGLKDILKDLGICNDAT